MTELYARAERWLNFSRDKDLPHLFLTYGEEFGVTCDPDWPMAMRMSVIGDLQAFALRADDRLVGFALVRLWPQLPFKGKPVAFVSEIYVDPVYRGGGTKLLLDKVMQRMREQGCAKITLHHGLTSPAVFPPLGATGIAMRLWAKDL
jgi:GNAT superfamily N-acetyltransferase